MTNTIATKLTNNAAKVSSMTAALYNKSCSPQQAAVLATALITCEERMERGLTKWAKRMSKAIRGAEVTAAGNTLTALDIFDYQAILVSADLIVVDAEQDTVVAGEYLNLLNAPTLKHYPTPVTETLERRHNYGIKKPVKLMKDAIHALEGSMFKVDEDMVKIAKLVAAKVKDDESYVLEGCEVMIAQGNPDTVAEYKADAGGRLYQAACHGPNGQSSDRSRAFMDLAGVSTDYDIDKVRAVIMEEMEDMAQNVAMSLTKIKKLKSYSEFIISELKLEGASTVKKPWSFVKAALILRKLDKGQKPYIGMAFGLDAKCSGPQYGALMVGDSKLAAACGFTRSAVDDAYVMAAKLVMAAGFTTITRAAIKTAFMATVYGQGAMALCNPEAYDMTNADDVLFWNAIYDEDFEVMQAKARQVRACIIKSLGKLGIMMNTVKNAHGEYNDEGQMIFNTNKATSFKMPDGQVIAPRYKVMIDILGDLADDMSKPMDVTVTVNNEVFVMKALKFKTTTDDLGKYQRTGLVRLIHSTDGLIARLIVTHLDQDEGAQHIVAIHDCFRVNINDYLDGKLHRAIEAAYLDLFGEEEDKSKSGYLKSVDMLKMYFDGVTEACGPSKEDEVNYLSLVQACEELEAEGDAAKLDEAVQLLNKAKYAMKTPKPFTVSQFDIDGDRILDEVNGVELPDLIAGVLDQSTGYFGK
jgi:hypothetical protein